MFLAYEKHVKQQLTKIFFESAFILQKMHIMYSLYLCKNEKNLTNK